MTARDELLASLTAERFAVRPRPVDTLARVEHVGRVDWASAFAYEPPPAPAEPEPASAPRPSGDRDRLRALMPGATPKEPR